ncbi:MAG: acyl-CoA reductase [Saprospiraceae bacterium]|nr:acyl-CoA reductase [Saprospiraceae bacterium]
MMTQSEKISLLDKLGQYIKNGGFTEEILRASTKNSWFTEENIRFALTSISHHYLNEDKIKHWLSVYRFDEKKQTKNIGLVLAGNIPLVGFHDILTVFLSGNRSVIKYSDKDDVLIPAMIQKMVEWNPETASFFSSVDKLSDYDAVIATGSNNTSKYFEYYFRDKPHLIRKNRNGVAVLDGNESEDDIQNLGKDIFMYFGLGCRNVSKIYIPESFELPKLLKAFDPWKTLAFHNKYKNNLDYNHALYLLNQEPFLIHDALILRESEAIASRVACVHYEYYKNVEDLSIQISNHIDEIQCIVGNLKQPGISETFDFGEAQTPSVSTYADGVDTMQFLLSLS